MIKKLSCNDHSKWYTTHDNGSVQSHDKEESKLNSTISVTSGAHTLTHDLIIIKNPLSKNNVASVKANNILTRSYY